MMKRLFDITLSLSGLILSCPLNVAIAASILLIDGAPVLYLSERCGKGDRRFTLYKFRTMVNGQHQMVNYQHDPRLTRTGKLLRYTAIDSLPELLNILKGDMSFVGPRAMPWACPDEPQYQNIGSIPGYNMRSTVMPGMTGVAQLYCTKYTSRRNKYRYDAVYIKNQSFALDMRLLAISVFNTLMKRWEK